jgi:uncharacterized protein (DUF983 family)
VLWTADNAAICAFMNTNQEIALAIVAAFFGVGVLTLLGAYLIIGIGWQEFDTTHGDMRTRARPSGLVLVLRAAARKCPVCGRGRIFKSYFTMNYACPVCNSVFWKNEGEWIGPMVIDYTVAVGGALLSWAALVFFSFSGTLQVVIPSVVAVGGGIGVVPWSRSFWTLFLYITGEMIAGDGSSA